MCAIIQLIYKDLYINYRETVWLVNVNCSEKKKGSLVFRTEELTVREKEMLIIFGCMNRELTHKRLGLACLTITDPLSKAATCSLRNKINEIPRDIWYRHLYCRIKAEMSEIVDKGKAARKNPQSSKRR